MSEDSAWMLANALVRISTPDSSSKPPRNEHSLFIRRHPHELSTPGSESPEQSGQDLITIAEETIHTSVLEPNARLKATSSLTSYHGMKYSKSSWYTRTTRTDPVRDKTRSRLHHDDTKKRRVSFLPSLEIQEYAQKETHMIPLEDNNASNGPVQIQWKYNENLLVSSSVPPPSFSLLETGTSMKRTESDSFLHDIGANSKHPANETYSFDDSNNEDLRNSSLEIPDFVKEQLVDIVKKGIVRSDNNKTIITEYAPLITPKKVSPIKKKVDFPPNSLDPLHPKLKFRRKRKDETVNVVKISIDNNDAIIPIALIKKVISKHTNYAFIPANLSIWIQDHTTQVFEHLAKLLYEQSRKDRKDFAVATPQDVCAVMKEYLGLDDSVNIPNLICSHLPMELWFEYNENP